MTTKIQKWGNSHAVRIPMLIMNSLFLQENDIVEITTGHNSIIIKKVTRIRRAKRSLEERFKNYHGDYQCTECNTGEPVGTEVW